MVQFTNSLDSLMFQKKGKSRCINQENPRGEKGKGGMAAGSLGPGRKGSPCMEKIAPGETRVLAEMEGPGVIQHIWMTVTDRTEKDYYVLRDLVLRIYWDDEEEPSVESPLGDFFCCGFARGCMVNSLPIVVNPSRGFNSYFQMPFRKKARITLENQHEAEIPAFFYQVDYTLYDEIPEDVAYFHAQWRRERLTEEYPTSCGTGTEDYFGGAWSFTKTENGVAREQTYCTPFMGYPYYSREDDTVYNPYHMNDMPTERGFYRWHIMDPILFDEDIRVTIQQIGVCHKGLFERQDDVSSVAYWYQSEPHQSFPKLLPREERWPR